MEQFCCSVSEPWDESTGVRNWDVVFCWIDWPLIQMARCEYHTMPGVLQEPVGASNAKVDELLEAGLAATDLDERQTSTRSIKLFYMRTPQFTSITLRNSWLYALAVAGCRRSVDYESCCPMSISGDSVVAIKWERHLDLWPVQRVKVTLLIREIHMLLIRGATLIDGTGSASSGGLRYPHRRVRIMDWNCSSPRHAVASRFDRGCARARLIPGLIDAHTALHVGRSSASPSDRRSVYLRRRAHRDAAVGSHSEHWCDSRA